MSVVPCTSSRCPCATTWRLVRPLRKPRWGSGFSSVSGRFRPSRGETRDVSRETLSGAVSEEPPHRACSLDSDMDQRMDALRRANEVRTLRAQLKRDLKAGRVSIGALLLDPPPFLETAKVFDMLLALPRHGRVKATKILHSCRVSPSTTFGGLSERQRTELAGHFDR